jgi:pimeloyl-ACP methyl ester carboxylesterase
MANYVLVHGAWGGGQSYDAVLPALRNAGHQVLVVALRGIGKRQPELHPGITLTDHIDDACEQIEEAGFGRFILVGHSYGGMVVTGVASRLGKRIDALAYLDAFVPQDGQSLWDITGEFEHNWYIDSQKFKPGYVDPIGGLDNFAPVPGLVGYHPLLTLLEGLRLSGDEQAIPRKAYVLATDWQPSPFGRFAEAARAAGWDYHEADCDHFVCAGQPEQMAQVLLGLAG